MELVLAAIIWNADKISYVPMRRDTCAEIRWDSFISQRGKASPMVTCVRAKWTCENGFQFVFGDW